MGLQLSDETLPLRAVAVHPAVNSCSGERCTDWRRLAQMPTETSATFTCTCKQPTNTDFEAHLLMMASELAHASRPIAVAVRPAISPCIALTVCLEERMVSAGAM